MFGGIIACWIVQPYVYLEDREIMISFDDPESWAAKGEFISGKGLAGFAIWEAGGDYKDLMLDAIRGTASFQR
ncbi:hypothetical protein K435DRAFT_871510 [Dendrothele bispora CBS 962.96]|uniref:GH18 domain-containing protein n=1 Tax=Dendrothele bispora (strain CBS 962.96) TaxID=1314807 RepID=A0A4S8L3W7_DENBC|nr:hypothetical protein K435DRAFT_871510 [Dendrothele bispora CBS 962.96]